MFDPDNILPTRALQRPVPFDAPGFFRTVQSPQQHLTVQPTDGGRARPLPEFLMDVAIEYGMDVRVLIVKLQVECSGVTRPLSMEQLDWAMGFGLTDSERMGSYRGFAMQVENAARALTGYLDSRHPFSVVGLVDQPMQVQDGIVRPKTLATAALYRYTPWIGNRPGKGYRPPFGNFLFYQVWTQFFGTEPQANGQPSDWKLIVPPDNWRQPMALPAEQVPTLREVARRLGLVHHEDAAHLKLYLGTPPREPEVPPPGPAGPAEPGPAASVAPGPGSDPTRAVRYPSGVEFARVDPRRLGPEGARYRPGSAEKAAPLVRAQPETKVSEHFTMGEFMPRDASYTHLRLAPALVALCEEIRTELGGFPLYVNSGYRPPAYNQLVGGVPNSQHLDGLAADLSTLSVPFQRLAEVADRVVGDRGGVGLYWGAQFVHVDLRGERARWP